MHVSNLVITITLFYANPAYSFCGQDEDHDPNIEFEECLDCVVCENIGKGLIVIQELISANSHHQAHRQCARNAGIFDNETGTNVTLIHLAPCH